MEDSARLGWAKLHRKLLDHPRFSDGDWLKVWTACLLLASHKPQKKVFGAEEITLRPGQFITSQNSLFNLTKVQRSKIERVLRQLKTDKQIDKQGSNKSRLITVLNWGEYQETDKPNEKQLTNDRQTSDNKQELEELREEEFRQQFEAFRKVYPGRKRGSEVEWKTLKTKYPKRYAEILPLLLPAAQAYASHCEAEGTEKRFIKQMKTWINNECWTEEYPANAAKPLTHSQNPEEEYALDSFRENSNG